jgi:MFS family permease
MNKELRFNQQGLRVLAWLIALSSLVLIAAGGSLYYWNGVIALIDQGGYPEAFTGLLLALGYGIVGLLILSYRPGHGVGWLFLGVAFISALDFCARQYALYGLVIATLPGAIWMGWLQSWISYLIFPAPIILLFLLFPDGKLPSRRWGLLAWLGVLSTVCLTIGQLVTPGLLGVYLADSWISLGVFNPTGVVGWAEFSDALNYAWFLSIILLPSALLAPIWRYRRAQSVERQQLKWFVYFAILTLLFFPLAFIGGSTVGDSILLFLMLILPAATAIAILRHRLYDIDVIVKRTLQYGALSAILAAIYFASVIVLQAIFTSISGQSSDAAIAISTLIIAVLFTPLRRRIQEFIDRRFFRRKYDAEQTLARFAIVARDEVDMEILTAALLGVVEETMQPKSISIRVNPIEK